MLMHIDPRIVDSICKGVRVVRGGTPKDVVQPVRHVRVVGVCTRNDDGDNALERP